MEELKITKEKVLEAAKKCPQAKEILRVLFPKVFEEGMLFDESKIYILPSTFSGNMAILSETNEGKYFWKCINNSSNRYTDSFVDGESAISYGNRLGKVMVFDSTKSFVEWTYRHIVLNIK